MAEFAGYVGNQVPPIDWGKIGTDLYDKINKVNDEREAKRQKIDDDYNESFSKIGEYEQTTDQSLNEMIYKGVDEVRNSMKTQYDLLKRGAITMSDYKLYKNTAMTDWSTLNKAVKGYGNTIAGVQKLITEGKMSGLGQYNALTYAKLSNLKDAKIMVNPETGRIYRANIDPKTGTIASDSEVYSPSAMLNPGNLVDLKVDLNDGVTKFLKTVADYGIAKDLGGGRIEVTEDARKNPAYQKALEAQVNSFTVTPRSTTSVLTDYVGDYQFFESEAQKKELINKGVKEDKLIKVERKNGVYEPVPTSTQEEVAKGYVRSQIEVGVGRKETQTQGYAPQRAEKADKPSVYEMKEEKRLAGNINKAKIANEFMDPTGGLNRFGEVKQIAIDNGVRKPLISERADGTKILLGIPRGKTKQEVIQEFRTPAQAYAYLTGKANVLQGADEYDEAVQEADLRGVSIKPAPKQAITFDMKAARQMAPDLSDEEIKAKIIKQYPGKKLIWKN
jgi:hypothetical protein